MKAKILVTGAAGFIGSHVAHLLAERGDEVVGVDNMNDYYDVKLKYARLRECGIECESENVPLDKKYVSNKFPNYCFVRLSIESKDFLNVLFGDEHFDKVIHLAAQPGVQYSKEHPENYITSNVMGFINVLEACRHHNIKHLVYASSSSVYGINANEFFSEEDKVSTPLSLYAASKIANESMAHCYAHQYGISCIGLRFFTVYGPWGRPDMTPMLFANNIREGKEIVLYGNGDIIRDFTYIDDIAAGIICANDHQLVREECPNNVPSQIYNIGGGSPIRMIDFVKTLEKLYGKNAKIRLAEEVREGDVKRTSADLRKLQRDFSFVPHWSLENGLAEFVNWHKSDKNPLNK